MDNFEQIALLYGIDARNKTMKETWRLIYSTVKFPYQEIDFEIIPYNIPLCCQIFFYGVWNKISRDIPEYVHASVGDPCKTYLLCPNCLIKKLEISHQIRLP